jgi:ABC-type transport system substrate-binding protein
MIPAGVAKPGVTCGTGPFILQRFSTLDYSQVRDVNYWRGWPADWPNPPSADSGYTKPQGIKPVGYINRVTFRARDYLTGIEEFKAGAADFTAIPRLYAPRVHVDQDRNKATLQGIRLNYPIPSLVIDTFHMTFNIAPTEGNDYGKIYGENDLHEDGIPCNFFANKDVRYAFAYLINWTMILNDLYLGEAYQPWTVAPTGLPYVPSRKPKFSYNEDLAEQYFRAATFAGKKLTDYGFTVYITYNLEAVATRGAQADQLAASINKVGSKIYSPNPSKFHAIAKGVDWETYIPAMDAHELPCFFIGWLADYADAHNFYFPFCHSAGTYAHAQKYKNPIIDDLLDKGVYTPDGPAREAIYAEVANRFEEDSPTIPIVVAVGRGYMRDWVQGWYYNPLYPGGFFYNKWKWPMLETPDDCCGIIPNGYWVGDKDYDNKVSMDDIMKVLRGFGSYAGKAGMPVFHPRWNFYLDVDDMPKYRWRDRKIDTGDLVVIIKYFGKTSTGWQPPP